MNSLLLPIVLQIAFFLLLLGEIALPSGGILGIAAAAAGVGSWVLLVGLDRPELLWLFGIVDLLLLPIAVWGGVRLLHFSPLANRTELSADEGYRVTIDYPVEWIGREAVVVGTLRPSGEIELDGQIVEALSDGPMISKGEKVVILSVSENKLIVSPQENSV